MTKHAAMLPMDSYAMLYEEIVLATFGVTWRGEDPFGLGDADIFRLVDNKLSGQYGHNLKFGLSAALRKAAKDNQSNDLGPKLLKMDSKVWMAKSLNDFCIILSDVQKIFQEMKYPV